MAQAATRTAQQHLEKVREKRHFHFKRLTVAQVGSQGDQTASLLQTSRTQDLGASSAADNGQLGEGDYKDSLPLKKNSVVVQLKQTLEDSRQERDSQDLLNASQVSQRFSFRSLPAQHSGSARTSPSGQKFRFLKKLIQREEQSGQKPEQAFVPYT